MSPKELARTIGNVTIGPIISALARVLVRAQGLPIVRRSLGGLYDAMRISAHKNSEERAKIRYDIHPTAYWGEETLVYGDGNIKIGEHSYCGTRSFLLAHPAGINLTIGKYCAISHNVHIRTEVNKKRPHYRDDLATSPAGQDITIGDYVWIGANVFIGGGISIGDNSIIGANSVVTTDVPSNSIFAGVPAKLVGMKTDYADPAT